MGVKARVYRKVTHTEQYLSFRSNHLLNNKLGVICTLYDICDNSIMKEADVAAEITHMDKALGRCGYRKWPFR